MGYCNDDGLAESDRWRTTVDDRRKYGSIVVNIRAMHGVHDDSHVHLLRVMTVDGALGDVHDHAAVSDGEFAGRGRQFGRSQCSPRDTADGNEESSVLYK